METQSYTPLHYAAKAANNGVVQLLLVAKANILAKGGSRGMTPQEEVRYMHDMGVKARNSKDHDVAVTLTRWTIGLKKGSNPSPTPIGSLGITHDFNRSLTAQDYIP